MGYTVGDKVEYIFEGKKGITYLVAITPRTAWKDKYVGIIWNTRQTRVSHLALIGEEQITKKISSNFEGYNKQLQKEKEI